MGNTSMNGVLQDTLHLCLGLSASCFSLLHSFHSIFFRDVISVTALLFLLSLFPAFSSFNTFITALSVLLNPSPPI